MKPLIPVLVVATTSLAVASVQFHQQASAQRERANAEAGLRQKQEVRVAQLERNQARLERELMQARSAPATVAMAPPPPPRPNEQRPVAGAAAGVGVFGVIGNGAPGVAQPPVFNRGPGSMQSPAARNFFRTRIKNSMRQMYADAGSAMGLSAEKSNQLLDLLADQQTRNFGQPPAIPEGQTPQQYFQDQQKKNNEEIKALIGADKVDDWATFQKSLPDRAQLAQVGDQLEQSGVPMTESQRSEMLAAITEESQRLPRPTYTAGVPPEEMMAQSSQWQAEYDKALLDRAKQVLNTEQYNAYKDYQAWQAEMRNSMPRPFVGQGGRNELRMVAPAGGAAMAVDSVTFGSSATLMAVPPQPQPK
jgi:hypothetical protein